MRDQESVIDNPSKPEVLRRQVVPVPRRRQPALTLPAVGPRCRAWPSAKTSDLAAFRNRIVASLCADVEPVAFMFQHSETGRIAFVDAWQKENGWALANPRYSEVGTMHGASTVASLTAQRDQALARVAELEKDAARGRLLLKWLWSGHIPGPAWGRPIKLVETCPQFGDETEVKNIEALLDAALTKGQP